MSQHGKQKTKYSHYTYEVEQVYSKMSYRGTEKSQTIPKASQNQNNQHRTSQHRRQQQMQKLQLFPNYWKSINTDEIASLKKTVEVLKKKVHTLDYRVEILESDLTESQQTSSPTKYHHKIPPGSVPHWALLQTENKISIKNTKIKHSLTEKRTMLLCNASDIVKSNSTVLLSWL